MDISQDQQSQNLADCQAKISAAFTQSLTEEQHFLQDVMTGKIKLVPHDEVMQKLESVLKNGLERK